MRHSAILNAALAMSGGLLAAGAIERQIYDYARERKFPPPETLARKAAELAGGDFPYASLADAPEGARVYFTAFRAVIEALEPFHEPDPAEGADEDYFHQVAKGAGEVDRDFSEIALIFRSIDNNGGEELHFLQAETLDGEFVRIGTWTEADDLKTMHLTVHKSDIRGSTDASSSEGAVAASQTANGTEARDGAEPAAAGDPDMGKAGPGEADPVADPAADPGGASAVSEAPSEDSSALGERTTDAQAETDKVIAESGGKFSEDAPKKKQK